MLFVVCLFKQAVANLGTTPYPSVRVRGGAEYLFRYIPPRYCVTYDSIPYTPVHKTNGICVSHTGRHLDRPEVDKSTPSRRRHYTCWFSAKMWTKMSLRTLQVLVFVLLWAFVVSDGLLLGNPKCGEKRCKRDEFCSPPDDFCKSCAIICDTTSHNYEEKFCERQCQSKCELFCQWGHVIT